jgi:hypothetical protein
LRQKSVKALRGAIERSFWINAIANVFVGGRENVF